MTFRDPLRTIDGSQITIQTASTPPRWVIGGSAGAETIAGYTASPTETLPAELQVIVQPSGGGDVSVVTLTSAEQNGHGTAAVKLFSENANATGLSVVDLVADQVNVLAAELDITSSIIQLASGARFSQFNPATAPSFAGTVFANFGGGYVAAGYIVDALGWVHLQGLAFNGSAGAASAGALVASGFPAPASAANEPLPTVNGAATSMLLKMSAAGALTILAGSCPAGQNVVLSGCCYQS